MTREQVVELAREVGFHAAEADVHEERLARFANLVVAAEREACAKMCDDLGFEWHKHAAGGPVAAYNACADAIRARGEQR